MSDVPVLFSGEVALLDWSESSKAGAKLVLALASPDDLDPFRLLTTKKAGRAGQRLAVVMVKIDDDTELPEKPEQPVSVQAALLCKTPSFWQFVEKTLGYGHDDPSHREAMATQWLRGTCGIISRADLDRDAVAAAKYRVVYDRYVASRSIA